MSATPKGNSPFGVADLLGNVSEWTADPDPDQVAQGIHARELSFILRGSSWIYAYDPERTGAAHRLWSDPGVSSGELGFRCAVGDSG